MQETGIIALMLQAKYICLEITKKNWFYQAGMEEIAKLVTEMEYHRVGNQLKDNLIA